jgi:hypothetical protein
MAKYEEQLEECKKYRDFLDKLTPHDWFQQVKQKKHNSSGMTDEVEVGHMIVE